MEIWNEGRIQNFADVKGGKRLPKGKQLAGFPTAHPYIRIRDIGKSKVLQLTSDYAYIDDETQKEISRYIVSKGDILISVVGTIGLVGIVGDTLDGANQTENCDKLTNFRGIDRDFLYYYLVSPLGQGEIAKGTVGAVQPKLPLKNIQDFAIRFPSLQTQKKIASMLSVLDDKIEKNTEINDNLAYAMSQAKQVDTSRRELAFVRLHIDSVSSGECPIAPGLAGSVAWQLRRTLFSKQIRMTASGSSRKNKSVFIDLIHKQPVRLYMTLPKIA